MKKVLYIVLIAVLALTVSACGKKSNTDIRTALSEKVKSIQGYKVKAKMNLKAGSSPQTYDVEVWYHAPNHYRVNLKNAKSDQNQIILRNKEGVFVLTPALNKSFHFQSNWPKNGGQAYLYQSLVKDILDDKSASFKETKNTYVFETKTRYANNQTLPIQEVTFDKKTLAPKKVRVLDTDRNELVTVEFGKMNFKPKFGQADFDVKKNMTGAQLEFPVTAPGDSVSFQAKYPTAEIAGVEAKAEKKVLTAGGEQLILTFAGNGKSYTLIESRAEVAKTVSSTTEMGEPVDLGYTIASVTDHSVSWTYEGVDFLLASNDLTKEELITVAGSVQEVAEK